MRWLLGAQLTLAALLVGAELAPALPGLVAPSRAPALDRPTQPGDQTRRYRPDAPPGAGVDGEMPSRLTAVPERIAGRDGLRLRGAIAPGDGERVAAEIDRLGPALVALDSPGGSVGDALAIGRALRRAGADTLVPEGAVCLSACPYVFAGGVARAAGAGARIGVHQHAHGASTILPAFLAVEDMQRGQAEVLDHLSRMGVDLRIMGPAMATPPDEIYILSEAELADWAVVTP